METLEKRDFETVRSMEIERVGDARETRWETLTRSKEIERIRAVREPSLVNTVRRMGIEKVSTLE